MNPNGASGERPSRGDVARTFDAIADEFAASRTTPWPETASFASLLPAGSLVLDLGCGNGRNFEELRRGGRAVVGVDPSWKLLEYAARAGSTALVQADAVSLPFRDVSFDAVHCVAALHHLPSDDDRRRAVTEMARVLRVGGRGILSVWAREQERFRGAPSEDVFVPWRRSDGRDVPRFYHPFREGELGRIVRAGGLEPEREWREGDNHVVLAVKRDVER